MTEWDWSLRIFDHVDVHASDYAESVRFYETVLPHRSESRSWPKAATGPASRT
jgi:predicted enzyme related to lactoylglutathione lyase